MRANILIVDDHPEFRAVAAELLQREGYGTCGAANREEALARLRSEFVDLVLLDERLDPYDSGLEVLGEIREEFAGLGAVMVSGHADLEMAVRAMRAGAMDLLVKPTPPGEFLACVKRSLESTQELRRVRRLRWESAAANSTREILGTSGALTEALSMALKAAPTSASVLIQGESGTGKELLARAIHGGSQRRHREMIGVNVGGIPESLMETTLFGSRRGAYTGSVADQAGVFQAAHGSTLFLDEVGEMTPGVQVRLLRVLQEKAIQRVGDVKPTAIDVRVIAATNRDLAAEVAAGRFREDLYYRLAVLTVQLPPLRERPSDIAPLASFFLGKHARELGREFEGFSAEALTSLESYGWPGNIRELDNVIQRAVILESTRWVGEAALRLQPPAGGVLNGPFEEAERRFRTAYYLNLLRAAEWNVTKAAQMAGVHRSTIHEQVKELGLKR